MFRIGFDPLIEAQQDHERLMRENQLLRQANEGKQQTHSAMPVSRMLAKLGKGIASIGISLETRYGSTMESGVVLSTQDSPSGCSD